QGQGHAGIPTRSLSEVRIAQGVSRCQPSSKTRRGEPKRWVDVQPNPERPNGRTTSGAARSRWNRRFWKDAACIFVTLAYPIGVAGGSLGLRAGWPAATSSLSLTERQDTH